MQMTTDQNVDGHSDDEIAAILGELGAVDKLPLEVRSKRPSLF